MTPRNAYCINQLDQMRNQPHPWNLRRIFGRQFVVCVCSPSRPEAGIATQVIPAQSSRRTFRGPSDADLATLVVDVHRCANPHTLIRPNSGVTPTFNRNVEELASSRASRTRKLSQGPATVRTSSSVIPRGTIFLNSLFPTGDSEEQFRLHFHQRSRCRRFIR